MVLAATEFAKRHPGEWINRLVSAPDDGGSFFVVVGHEAEFARRQAEGILPTEYELCRLTLADMTLERIARLDTPFF